MHELIRLLALLSAVGVGPLPATRKTRRKQLPQRPAPPPPAKHVIANREDLHRIAPPVGDVSTLEPGNYSITGLVQLQGLERIAAVDNIPRHPSVREHFVPIEAKMSSYRFEFEPKKKKRKKRRKPNQKKKKRKNR